MTNKGMNVIARAAALKSDRKKHLHQIVVLTEVMYQGE
jgi:hypothetical protein